MALPNRGFGRNVGNVISSAAARNPIQNSGNRQPGTGNRPFNTAMSRGRFLRTAGAVGGAVAAAGLGLGDVAKAHLPHAMPSADNPDPGNIIGKKDANGNPVNRPAVTGDKEIWVYPTGDSSSLFQNMNLADFTGSGSIATKDIRNIQWAVGLRGMSHEHNAYWVVSVEPGGSVNNNDYFMWFDGENENWFEFQVDDSYVSSPDRTTLDVRGNNNPEGIITAIYNVTYRSYYLTNDLTILWLWSPTKTGASSNAIRIETNSSALILTRPSGWVNSPPAYGLPSAQDLQYWGYDVIQFPETGVAPGGTILLKAKTNPNPGPSVPMYFHFGDDITGVGHVELSKDVFIKGERLNSTDQIQLPNSNIIKQFDVQYGDLRIPSPLKKTVQPRTTIYGGGCGPIWQTYGAFFCNREIDFSIDGVWFDSSRAASVMVAASKSKVVINDCVGTNYVAFDLIDSGPAVWGILFATDLNLLDFRQTPPYINGEIQVTNNVMKWQKSWLYVNFAITVHDCLRLSKLTVLNNIVEADESMLLLAGSLTDTIVTANGNTLKPLNSGSTTFAGIEAAPHPKYGRLLRGKSVYASNNWIYGAKNQGINARMALGPVVISNNHILDFYGDDGESLGAIALHGSSNCTVSGNVVNQVGGDVVAIFGIECSGNSAYGSEYISQNNHIFDNVVSGRYSVPFNTHHAENCTFERNDFSGSEAVQITWYWDDLLIGGEQAFVGDGTVNCTFKNNKYGSAELWGLRSFSESCTFTNENFMGNYPGWSQGLGCVLFDGRSRNNTMTALKNGQALQGFSLCEQVASLPDYLKTPDVIFSEQFILPSSFVPDQEFVEEYYVIYPTGEVDPDTGEPVFVPVLAVYDFPPLGYDNPNDLRTAQGYQRQFFPGYKNAIRTWDEPLPPLPKTAGGTITLYGTEGNSIEIPVPTGLINLETDDFIYLGGEPLPPILKKDSIPGYEKCLNKGDAFLAAMRDKANAVNQKLEDKQQGHSLKLQELKAKLEQALGTSLPYFPTNKQELVALISRARRQ